jgi:hypothetical protein
MIKWGTFGQKIWGTYGQFKKVFGNAANFILFQNRFKKKKYLTVDPMSAFRLATDFSHSSVEINEITFWFSCGFFVDFCHLVETSSLFLESSNRPAKSSSDLAECSRFLKGFL